MENKYIAHIRSSDKTEQTAQEHNNNVAELAFALGDAYGIAHMAAFSGRHHDDGKNTPEYYSYIKAASAGEHVVRGSVIHSTYGACMANELAEASDHISRLTAEMIRTAVMSHHGLRDAISRDGVLIYRQAADHVKDSYEAVRKIIYKNNSSFSVKAEFAQAYAEAEQINAAISRFQPKSNGLGSAHIYLAFYVRLLTSILIDADRTDTACFEDKIKPPKQPSTAELKKLWHGYRDFCDIHIQHLQSEKEPSPLDEYRAEISEACAHFDGGSSGIFRLVVPCGAGKTLSALRYALQTAEHYGKRRIFYIAPYNSILEQNAREIEKYIGDEGAVLRHHSNIVFDDDEEALQRYKLLTENWTQSPIIATSAVQFLNTMFSSKTSAVRRMQALGESIIIVDEIQAFPIKILKLFNAAMNFLAYFCNTAILLCSATQPLLDELNEYKIINPTNLLSNADRYSEAFRRVKIVNNITGSSFSFDDAADCIFQKAQSVKSLLAIVNTKNAAREISKRLDILTNDREKFSIYHLSTNMCPAHRTATINEMRESLRDRDSNRKIICISTNLIEAGVDVSFESVVRSLSGLDSIIQAAGRCNRNREAECGTVSVVYIKDENINMLPYIKQAQEITREVMYNIENNPKLYPEGALSKRALDEYYSKLYQYYQKKEMAFPLKDDPEHTIVDLLTTNPVGSKRCKTSEGVLLKQAFKQAGDAFEVIDDYGKKDVIVEFNDDARAHIKELLNSSSIFSQKKQLRYLQQYTVQLMPYTIEKIGLEIQTVEELGIMILSGKCYDRKYGVL